MVSPDFNYPFFVFLTQTIMMKKIFILPLAAFSLLACQSNHEVTVTVENPLGTDRMGEIVEVPMEDVSARLNLPDTAQLVIYDAESQEVPYQITHEGNLIFPASVSANAASTYTIAQGVPATVTVRACGRQYPERMDDMAWENDVVAFRAYGPALQAKGERGYGYDLFLKRGTTEPILEELYKNEVDPKKWEMVNELRKTDKKAAAELSRKYSYHVDHGYGMDCYAVGPTLGAGVAALMADETIVYPWCYKDYEILDNGPLRFSVKLTFHPQTVKADTSVVETRVITLDAGSHFNRTAVSYQNLSEAAPIVAGIVLHNDEPATTVPDKGYMTYTDPTTGADNGKLFMGAVFPTTVQDMKTVLFSADEKKQRNNAEGHVLAYNTYEPGSEYVYYWGYGWDRSDIESIDAWNKYVADFADRVQHPLTVTVK